VSDFAHDRPDGFAATNAIAAAAVRRTLALVMRTSEKKRVRLEEGGVFICFYLGGLRFWLERIGKAVTEK
jgi:hypothetical protein